MLFWIDFRWVFHNTDVFLHFPSPLEHPLYTSFLVMDLALMALMTLLVRKRGQNKSIGFHHLFNALVKRRRFLHLKLSALNNPIFITVRSSFALEVWSVPHQINRNLPSENRTSNGKTRSFSYNRLVTVPRLVIVLAQDQRMHVRVKHYIWSDPIFVWDFHHIWAPTVVESTLLRRPGSHNNGHDWGKQNIPRNHLIKYPLLHSFYLTAEWLKII